jgi:hypothetical protein
MGGGPYFLFAVIKRHFWCWLCFPLTFFLYHMYMSVWIRWIKIVLKSNFSIPCFYSSCNYSLSSSLFFTRGIISLESSLSAITFLWVYSPMLHPDLSCVQVSRSLLLASVKMYIFSHAPFYSLSWRSADFLLSPYFQSCSASWWNILRIFKHDAYI